MNGDSSNSVETVIEESDYDVLYEDELDFVSETFELQYLGELGEETTKCHACFGTGLDRYEDVDCMTCYGDGVV